MRKMSLMFVAVMALSLLAGSVKAGEKLRLGLCMASLDTFLSSLADAAAGRAAEKGVQLTVLDAQDDPIRQSDQLNTLLQDNIDAVIINIVDTASAPPMVNAARRAGKPLVFVNRNPFYGRDVPPDNYVVSSNTLREGAVGMEYVGKALNGEGNIIILMGTMGHEAAINRSQGVKDVITEQYPNIKILDEQTGNWFRDQGMTVTENLITAHGDKIDAILANNDEMALGALRALESSNMRDKVIVVGVDGTADGLQSVKNGGITATAYQDPVAQGSGAVDIAIRVVNGEKVNALNPLPVTLVTKENVGEFLKK